MKKTQKSLEVILEGCEEEQFGLARVANVLLVSERDQMRMLSLTTTVRVVHGAFSSSGVVVESRKERKIYRSHHPVMKD